MVPTNGPPSAPTNRVPREPRAPRTPSRWTLLGPRMPGSGGLVAHVSPATDTSASWAPVAEHPSRGILGLAYGPRASLGTLRKAGRRVGLFVCCLRYLAIRY